MSPRLPAVVLTHLEKSREAALLAVEVYNKPGVAFRSGGYIVLMCIAWTALLHATFFRAGRRPFYRDPERRNRYQRVDGDYRAWELKECVREYFGSQNSSVRKNLEFFIGLRNKIEHRSMPELDPLIFGECQALLFNYEDILVSEFGRRFALNESLSMAVQFSRIRHDHQLRAISELRSPLQRSVYNYITTFRSGLSTDELNDLRFSYKVFLIPKIANHPGQADVAVEFVKYDATKPDQMEKYERLVAMIKPVVTEAANVGRLRAVDVCKAVEPVVKRLVASSAKFVPSHHHVVACYFYRIRPRPSEGNRRKTNPQYCHYDEAHQDYVYTEAWKQFLIEEMRKPGQYETIFAKK
jgi:hypothetical protein